MNLTLTKINAANDHLHVRQAPMTVKGKKTTRVNETGTIAAAVVELPTIDAAILMQALTGDGPVGAV